MRKKEIIKIATKMLVYSSKEEKLNAEKGMQKLADIVFEQENPLDIMSEIDIYIQERIWYLKKFFV